MHSLSQEIYGFSQARLKKQSTRVTTVTGKRFVERRRDEDGQIEVEEEEKSASVGFVEDHSLDLQVGVIRPFMLLSSQDVAHDLDTLRRYKVSHVLNVSYGVDNVFPDQFNYKTVSLLDLPETDITTHLPACFQFIDQAREQQGMVLLHCNAGVSRSASVAIGYLMAREGLLFDDAYEQVKLARSSICPNPGFYRQLQNYKP
ncbi:dual specificity protein phosphatase 19-like [Aplochiton taeniatus]